MRRRYLWLAFLFIATFILIAVVLHVMTKAHWVLCAAVPFLILILHALGDAE